MAQKFGNVTNIDLFDRPIWPVSDYAPLGLQSKNFPKSRVEFVYGRFQDFASESGKKFDAIVDSCSLIHFGDYGQEDMESMLSANGKLISRLLRDSYSRFFTVTDVSSDQSWEFKDFIFFDKFIRSLTKGGDLKLVSEPGCKISSRMPKTFYFWWRNEPYQGKLPLYKLAEPDGTFSDQRLEATNPAIFHGFGRGGIVTPVAFGIFQKNDGPPILQNFRGTNLISLEQLSIFFICFEKSFTSRF